MVYFSNQYDEENSIIEGGVYQGPVRPSDDEEHFRKTGDTISKEIILKKSIDEDEL